MFILVTMDSEIFSEQIADIKAKMIIDIIFNIDPLDIERSKKVSRDRSRESQHLRFRASAVYPAKRETPLYRAEIQNRYRDFPESRSSPWR